MAAITEIKKFEDEEGFGEWSRCDGWSVTTEDQTVVVAISNSQSCCESWGYVCSEDDPSKYIGAELLRVERVAEDESGALVTSILKMDYGLDGGGAVFVNIVTDRGTFQLAVYNAHNGYYGHEAVVISRELNLREVL